MRASLFALFGLTALVAASPFKRSTDNSVSAFANTDNFPNPNPQQLLDIAQRAHGTLPNGSVPASISQDTVVSLSLIAMQETFEAVYFQQLLTNITNGVSGYNISNARKRQLVIQSIQAIVAQEELHALQAIGALSHYNQPVPQPCKYNFPVTTFEDAIVLASTFTSVVLGTLQDVVLHMGLSGDAPLSQSVVAIVGQEGEQEGLFRILQQKIPNELPFLSASVRDFAYNALVQNFIVPGSCPNLDQITALSQLHTMEPLTIVTPFSPNSTNEQITVSFGLPSGTQVTDYQIAYINQQNVPVFEPLTAASTNGSIATANALFPFNEHEMNGLTIAAIVPGAAVPSLTSNQAVANNTLAGPGLIIVN